MFRRAPQRQGDNASRPDETNAFEVEPHAVAATATPSASAAPSAAAFTPARHVWDNGTKFPGGFGETLLLTPDYWTLRQRSSELFERNLYARGIVRRLVTNEVNTGLHLEATPEERILGFAEDELADWTENVENRFKLWESEPNLCDQRDAMTFGALQAQVRLESLVAGDVLVVLRQDQRTGLPRVQLISGSAVQTPLGRSDGGGAQRDVAINHGVELDGHGRQVAYWIQQEDGTSKRLPAFGEKSGRRIAWLVYGTEKRLDDVRGKPLLALVLQSLKEIDRYRDSTQRKAVINSMLAMYISKTEDKPGSRAFTGGAVRRGVETTVDAAGQTRTFHTAELIPGMVIDELQHGEEPKAFTTNGTTEAFGTFEQAVLASIAWANQIPPEILTLSFSSNYSASQAAINEFKMYLNKVRTDFGQSFCQPVYVEWLLSEVMLGRVTAHKLLEAWRTGQNDTFGAWVAADWSGHIKPAVDLSKLVAGYTKMLELGAITHDRASRELTGTKYSKNVQKLRRENEQLAHALEPLAKLEALRKARR